MTKQRPVKFNRSFEIRFIKFRRNYRSVEIEFIYWLHSVWNASCEANVSSTERKCPTAFQYDSAFINLFPLRIRKIRNQKFRLFSYNLDIINIKSEVTHFFILFLYPQRFQIMTFRFSAVVLSLTVLLGGLIYMLHLLGLVTAANEVYARFCALGLFVAGFLLLGWQKVKSHRFSWDDIYKNDTFIVFSLTTLLASLYLSSKLSHSYYIIGVFAFAGLIHFFYTRKFYPPPTFFYLIFAYALLLFFGTIGTQKGFRFPSQTLSFYVLPLAYCCFCLSKKTLLQIGGFFYKTGIIFLSLCVLYWWFNFLHLNVNFVEWITGKTTYETQMIGWKNVINYHAYYFVNAWSYRYHPTQVSIVVLGGLITGFYLYYKKDEFPTISKWDLLIYTVFCLLIILLMQSRIGVVGFILIIGITGLYYLKLKTKYFKIALLAYFLLGGASLMVFGNKVSGFVNDDIRDAYRKIAISYIQEHFWWGSGFDEQRFVLEQQAEKIKDILPAMVYPNCVDCSITHVHNQFLGIMVQFGILGLIVLIAMLAAIAYYAIKNRSYLLLTFLGFMFFFMLIEEGEYILMLIFITFFTAINEAKNNLRFTKLKR